MQIKKLTGACFIGAALFVCGPSYCSVEPGENLATAPQDFLGVEEVRGEDIKDSLANILRSAGDYDEIEAFGGGIGEEPTVDEVARLLAKYYVYPMVAGLGETEALMALNHALTVLNKGKEHENALIGLLHDHTFMDWIHEEVTRLRNLAEHQKDSFLEYCKEFLDRNRDIIREAMSKKTEEERRQCMNGIVYEEDGTYTHAMKSLIMMLPDSDINSVSDERGPGAIQRLLKNLLVNSYTSLLLKFYGGEVAEGVVNTLN
ncbi:MAG: hypothetical protein LBJ16_00790 [Holosporaceae bacterium]|nr:hypothetical protein [Holosporaceae bacterium]